MVKTDNQRRGGERVRMIDMHAHFFCIEKEALVTEELKLRRADGCARFLAAGRRRNGKRQNGCAKEKRSV